MHAFICTCTYMWGRWLFHYIKHNADLKRWVFMACLNLKVERRWRYEWQTSCMVISSLCQAHDRKKKSPKVFVFVKGMQKAFSVLCQKCSEVVPINSRQSRVQRHRLDNFQWRNCSMELQFCTGFSEVSDGVVWCVHAFELWRQVWLQKFVPFRVCQEDVLRNLIEEENYRRRELQ